MPKPPAAPAPARRPCTAPHALRRRPAPHLGAPRLTLAPRASPWRPAPGIRHPAHRARSPAGWRPPRHRRVASPPPHRHGVPIVRRPPCPRRGCLAEHPTVECRDLVGDLLTACPHLRVLATSPEPLRMTTEAVVRIGPLARAGRTRREAAHRRRLRGRHGPGPSSPSRCPRRGTPGRPPTPSARRSASGSASATRNAETRKRPPSATTARPDSSTPWEGTRTPAPCGRRPRTTPAPS
jgi:hypothetical protein